jgi:hypothetical protein
MGKKVRFASFSGFFILLPLCLLCGSAVGQEDHAKQKAIVQMRQVANAMKQCPEQQISSYQSECHVTRAYAGPPTNLEWDVLPSKTVRSPFQGVIEFTLPSHLDQSDPPDQPSKVHQKCVDTEAQIEAMGASTRSEIADEIAKKGPEWREGHYRYEFDVGSETPELVKKLWVAKDRSNNIVISPANDNGRECWVTAAKSVGSAKTENSAPKP